MHDSTGPRLGASLVAIVAGLLLLAGIILMPDLTPSDAVPVVGKQSERGRIAEELPPDATGLPRFGVELLDGHVAAVPLTTAVAALLMVPRRDHGAA